MSTPKKIILIVIDTLRADHLGCYGYKKNTSPAIDRLAKEGILFKHTFSSCSFTLPSITSILTSKVPSHHTVGFNQGLGKIDNDNDITLPEILKCSGYLTAGFVSTIVLRKGTNLNAGFDVYDDSMSSHELNRPEVLKRDGLETLSNALTWVERNKDNNFFLFIHYMDVHGPYVCPEPYDKEFANDVYPNNDLEVVPDTRPIGGIPEFQVLGPVRDSNGSLLEYHKNCGYYYSQYDGCIRYVDDIIGRLLAKLKESNIYDDCLLIITSDHGEAFGENNIFLYHGLTVTPEQISVPLIIKPHKDWNICHDIIEKPVSTIDIMPTLLSLCCPQDYDIGVDGISLKTLIEEKSDKAIDDRTLLSENETSFALIYPNKIMEMRKRDAVISNYFTHAPELIDSLNGKKYRWDTGKII